MILSILPPQGYEYEYLPRTDSTNVQALARGAGHIIAAGIQDDCRTRVGQILPPSGHYLCFSTALPLRCDPREARTLQNAAGTCARNAIGGRAKIRWLNDVVLGETPLCHIRCTAKDGVFVCGFIFDMDAICSVSDGGECTDPSAIMQSVCGGMAEAAAGFPENNAALLQAYCEHCLMIMKFVDVIYTGVPLYGFCFAINAQGGMMVMTQESSTIVNIYTGPCSLAAKKEEAPEMPPVPRI